MLRVATGLTFAILGGFILLFAFAHAEMVNPALRPGVRRTLIAEKMFVRSGIAEATYLGLFIVACGLGIAVTEVRRISVVKTSTTRE